MSQFQQPVISYATPDMNPNRSGRFFRSVFGWVLFVGFAVMLFLLLQKGKSTFLPISISEFEGQLRGSNVRNVTVEDDELSGQFRTPVTLGSASISKFRTTFPKGTTGSWAFTQWLMDNANGARIEADNNQNLLVNLLVPLVPWLLIFGFIWFFVFRQLRKSKTQPPQPTPVYVVNMPAPWSPETPQT